MTAYFVRGSFTQGLVSIRDPSLTNGSAAGITSMNRPRRALLATAGSALTLVFAVSTATADDWPQWGGNDPGRNMVSTEKNLPETFNARGASRDVRWMANLGTYIQGNPTISNGRVFVGTD